jgi:hypothetical protein
MISLLIRLLMPDNHRGRLQLANMPHCHFASGTDSERTVTLEVGAGVATKPTVATVPCPRSVGFSLTQMTLTPVGGPTTFRKGNLPVEYAIYGLTFCKLCSLCQPNPLPVAGGGCSSPYVWHQTPKIRCHDSYWWLTWYCHMHFT